VSAQTLLQQQAGQLHGRQMVMLVTIALHAVVIAGMMMMRVMPELRPPDRHLLPIDNVVEPPPVEKPQQLQVPDPILTTPFTPPPIAIRPVDIPLDISDNAVVLPPQNTGPVAAVATDGPGTATIPDIPSTPLQFRAVRPADDYYPSASQSMQEEGLAIVRVCVTPAGRLDGKPVIETTSGSPRLDAAALTWAREALRFTPATQRGVPIGSCKGFRVNFKLR
jgi:TonB family protein